MLLKKSLERANGQSVPFEACHQTNFAVFWLWLLRSYIFLVQFGNVATIKEK